MKLVYVLMALTFSLPTNKIGCEKQEPQLNLKNSNIFEGYSSSDLITELSIDPDTRITFMKTALMELTKNTKDASFSAIENDPLDRKSIATLILLIAKEDGMDPAYLLHLAKRESNLNAAASSPMSTAKGLFQFTENTWLCSVRTFGPAFGVTDSDKISLKRQGSCTVENQNVRDRLLSMRSNPKVSTQIAAAFSVQNYRILATTFGRTPNSTELYVLHLLGQRDGIRFLMAVRSTPLMPAFEITPVGAMANRKIFYTSDNRPKFVSEIYDELSLK